MGISQQRPTALGTSHTDKLPSPVHTSQYLRGTSYTGVTEKGLVGMTSTGLLFLLSGRCKYSHIAVNGIAQ